MPIEYVHEFDEGGNHIGGYTQSVPDMYVKEEPDCYSCNDSRCGECDPTRVDLSKTPSAAPGPRGGWGGVGYSNEPPF